MLNSEFQELKRLWSISEDSEEKAGYVQEMRDNLKKRNGDNSEYVTSYTSKGKHFNINECDVSGLFEVDGDMTPRGK